MSLSFMPFFWGDYWRDTSHLSDAEHVSYLRLISHYWQQGGLPTDDARLARIAGRSMSEWMEMREIISSFFTPEWRHRRIDRDLSRQKSINEANIERARKAAEKRWNASSMLGALPEAVHEAVPEAIVKQSLTNANHIQNQNHIQILEPDYSDTAYRTENPPDLEKEFWDEAVIMAEALGIPPKSRNSLIGKLLKMAGKDYNQVSAAMEDAVAKQVEDPVPWLIAALGGKKKSYSAKQKDKIDDAFAQLRAAGERRAAEWREKYGTEYGILPDTGDGGGEHHGELYTQSLERSYHLSEQRRSRVEEVQSGSLAKTNGSGGWDFD